MVHAAPFHINLLTIKLKSISILSVLASSIFWTVYLLTLQKCIENYRISSCSFFTHLHTYLGPLYQLKGVSATSEKRVALTLLHNKINVDKKYGGHRALPPKRLLELTDFN